MKKLLIGLTLLSSFLFINNVSAKSNYTFNKEIYFINLYGMTYDEMYNTISEYYSEFKSEDEIIKIASFYSGIYNYFINNYGEDYYVYSGYATNGYPAYTYEDMYTVKKSSASNLKFALTVNDYGKIIVSSNLSTWEESIFSVDATNKTVSLLRSNTNRKIAYFMNTDSSHISGYINNCHFYLSNIDKSFIYSTSLLSTMSFNMDGGVGTVVDTIIINGNTYSNSNEIFLVNDGLPPRSQGSKINISSTLKNELGVIVKINFSEFDKEKFIYLYNFNNQPGNENWHEITENDYEYSALLNGTLYVKMIDREQFLLNGDTTPVVSATYTFTDLLMYEDIIDTYNISDYAEIEYRYYGNNPAMFYYTTYRYGEVPEDTYCITGTGIYECNILNIKEITSGFYYHRKAPLEDGTYDYIRNFAYENSPTYSIKEYDHAVIEDLTKYPITHNEECPTCWTTNYYRSFVLDLSMYLKEENRGRYIYVYYSTDIYDKTIKTSQSSWNNDTNTNNKLENLTEETINPPTYEDSTEIKDYGIFNPFIDLINKKFPIINQMGFIISTFSIKENDNIPNLAVDLSSMGIPGKITLIDIETYKQCKEMLFFFEYFSICMIGIPKIINNIKSSLGGDK